MPPRTASSTTVLCAALVLAGAGRAPALDARAPDAELRRFAAADLPDGPYPGDFIDPDTQLLRWAGCPLTAANDDEALAIMRGEDRRLGYDAPSSSVRESDARSVVVTTRQRSPSAYRVLRRDFFQCDPSDRHRAPGAVGRLMGEPDAADIAWLARTFWAEQYSLPGQRLLGERVDEDAAAVTVRRTTAVHRSPDVAVREWALSVRRTDGLVRISDELVRTVPLVCPPAAFASGTATASPLRVTVAVEAEDPGSSRSRVVARLGNGSEEAVVVTLGGCPPVAFLVDDATGRTVSGQAPSVCTDPRSYLLHPGASHEIGSAGWPLPGSHTLPTGTYAVRALLEEWSCAGGGTLPTTASAPAAVLIEGALPRRATE